MYLPFIDDEGNEYGSFEVFHVSPMEAQYNRDNADHVDDGDTNIIFYSGWYWWACFPGCLPDGDPCGPFDTEKQAIDDARSV